MVLGLLADPVRWQILQALAVSDRRVGEITAAVGKPQNLVSYHLGELRKAGIVAGRRSSADGRDVYYRVDLTRCRELLGAAGRGIHPGLEVTPAISHSHSRRRRTPQVLFLCTGNSARSQMGAALLESRSQRAVSARSGGSHPKPLHPHAVDVMARRGIDIASNEPTHLDRFARTRFDRVITLCDKVREICPEFPGGPLVSHWSLADPSADGTYEAFDDTANELENRIDLLMIELAQPNERSRNVDN
jgi:protein-tyrosine-phosphatase/DNA-binding transcriptional ArsR family regulator